MGAGASAISVRHLSASDVGKLVAGLGNNYAEYERSIVDNAISGEILVSFNEKDIDEMLEMIGVKKLHQKILSTYLKNLIAADAAKATITASTPTETPSSKPSQRPIDWSEPNNEPVEATPVKADDETNITCGLCDLDIRRYPPGTWNDGWTCDWPGHQGPNGFTRYNPVYGCPTIHACNWGVCRDCYKSNASIAGLSIHEQNSSKQIIQPTGTISSSGDRKCEVNLLRIDPPAQFSSTNYTLVIQYRLYTRTEREAEELNHSHRSKVYCGDCTYSAESSKLFQRELATDSSKIHGELKFHVPAIDVQALSSSGSNQPVRFIYDDGSFNERGGVRWSEAKLTLPNLMVAPVPVAEAIIMADSVEETPSLPRCPHDSDHIMTISDFSEEGYVSGFVCDNCRDSQSGLRWFCYPCKSDICFDCVPIQNFKNIRCGHNPDHHLLARCSGNIYGSRRCDLCSRRQLEDDPEFYCCRIDDFDMCICCASQHQALEEIDLS